MDAGSGDDRAASKPPKEKKTPHSDTKTAPVLVTIDDDVTLRWSDTIQSDTLGTFHMPIYGIVYSDNDSEEVEEQQVRLLLAASTQDSEQAPLFDCNAWQLAIYQHP